MILGVYAEDELVELNPSEVKDVTPSLAERLAPRATGEGFNHKAEEIEAWLELVAHSYNVLPMDGGTFRVWARLMHRRSDTIYEDAMIAATASVHKLTVVTRNVADFADFGVQILNPFKTPKA